MSRLPLFVLLPLFLLGLPACSNEIGDECSADAECGPGRFCDRASRGGYCTISPCSGDSCPANSVCVEFPNEETYCMALCESSGDCRGGYECVDDGAPASYCRQKP